MSDVKEANEGGELAEKRMSNPLEEDGLEPSKRPKIEPLPEKNGLAGKDPAELDKQVTIEDEDEDEDEDVVVDQKGKGVVPDLKGKGKVIEYDDDGDEDDEDNDEDGSSSDDSSGSDLSGDGSDWEDDPLLEVDLNNILPYRTRKGGCRLQRGVRFLGDDPNKGKDV